MSRFFEDLEAQLYEAARAQSATLSPRARPWVAWLRAGRRSMPVAVATLATIAVVVVAIKLHSRGHAASSASNRTTPGAAVHGITHSATVRGSSVVTYGTGGMQVLGFGHLSPQQQHDLRFVFAAQTKAMKTAACAASPLPRTTTSQGSPSAALLSALGILRRAARPGDTPTIPHTSSPFFTVQAQNVYVRYVRRAHVEHGISYYIIPAGRLIHPPTYSRLCFAEWRTELRRELPRIPAAQRSATIALQSELISSWQRFQGQRASEGICIEDLDSTGSGGGTCETTNQVKSGGPLEGDGSTVIGVVPDGVASVTLRYPAGHGHAALTVNTRVVGNVFAVPVARSLQDNQLSPQIIWRSARGSVIKTLSAGGA